MAAKVRMAAQAGLAAQVGVVWRRTLGIKRLYVRAVRLLGAGYRARAAADAKRRTLDSIECLPLGASDGVAVVMSGRQ